MTQKKVIHWFRQDLRLLDNPAFSYAAQQGKIIPVYILDNYHGVEYTPGAASRLWLYHALHALNHTLEGKLLTYTGNPENILLNLIKQHNIKAVYWNRCYEPWQITRDKHIKTMLNAQGIEVRSFNSFLLWEPWDILNDKGLPYRVFTPFYQKSLLNAPEPRKPVLSIPKFMLVQDSLEKTDIDAHSLLPILRWDLPLIEHWQVSEQGAQARFAHFLADNLANYQKQRDFPAAQQVSRLSPYLHFGQISPNQLWHSALASRSDVNSEHFCRELAWREFSYHLLYYFPNLRYQNFQQKFDNFPWDSNPDKLRRWQRGQTGFPLIDAGMRELWKTGYMHNRVRMVVGSFLVKNLLLDWRYGERWFWDCLLDADLANNSVSWQWVAGCGADAVPYFRVFNPITQSEKFDPDGLYIRRFVPELEKLPTRYLFSPWNAPDSVLKASGVMLGKTYPYPIVDIKQTRQQALDIFAKLKK